MGLDLEQFDSDDSQSNQPTVASRGPLRFFLASIVILVVVAIVVLFTMLIGQGRDLVRDKHEPKTSSEKTTADTAGTADTKADEEADEETDKPDPAASPLDGASLHYSVENSTCSDATADAIPFFDIVVAAQSAGKWNEETQQIVLDNLAELNRVCRNHVPHLLAVQRAFVDPQAPPQLNALVKDGTWITQKRPAPNNAATPTGRFTTGLKNIHCSMEADGTSCTINNYAWDVPNDCKGKPATLRIDSSLPQPKFTCDAPVTGETTYDYGTALDNHGYACTVESAGISCWSEFTGHGFTLSREQLITF